MGPHEATKRGLLTRAQRRVDGGQTGGAHAAYLGQERGHVLVQGRKRLAYSDQRGQRGQEELTQALTGQNCKGKKAVKYKVKNTKNPNRIKAKPAD